ncbi:MAG TPA: hypothetical protein VGO21_01940 [Candidatus Paceibacterota bacterium]|jgi:hypothetical protein|nr:hypothetical protein [Candidatus Paceibacterota bacterium]
MKDFRLIKDQFILDEHGKVIISNLQEDFLWSLRAALTTLNSDGWHTGATDHWDMLNKTKKTRIRSAIEADIDPKTVDNQFNRGFLSRSVYLLRKSSEYLEGRFDFTIPKPPLRTMTVSKFYALIYGENIAPNDPRLEIWKDGDNLQHDVSMTILMCRHRYMKNELNNQPDLPALEKQRLIVKLAKLRSNMEEMEYEQALEKSAAGGRVVGSRLRF